MLRLTPSDAVQLLTALERALGAAYRRAQLGKYQEPHLVAALCFEIPQAINALKLSGNTNIKSSAVFVHQRPRVKVDDFPKPNPKSVEIGDLLLVSTVKKSGTDISRRALLLQAKMFNGFPIKTGHENQHHLYQNWPEFTYTQMELKGQKRKLTGFDLYEATQYLLLPEVGSNCCFLKWPFCFFECPGGGCGVFTAWPEKPLSHYRCFIWQLFHLIAGDAGKAFEKPAAIGGKGWDQTINDLIKVSETAVSTVVQTGTNSQSDARTQGLMFLAGQTVPGSILEFSQIQHLISNDFPELVLGETRGGGGIPIVEFVLRMGEAE